MMGEMPLVILNSTSIVQSHLLGVLHHHSVALLCTGLIAFDRQAGMQIPSRFQYV